MQNKRLYINIYGKENILNLIPNKKKKQNTKRLETLIIYEKGEIEITKRNGIKLKNPEIGKYKKIYPTENEDYKHYTFISKSKNNQIKLSEYTDKNKSEKSLILRSKKKGTNKWYQELFEDNDFSIKWENI